MCLILSDHCLFSLIPLETGSLDVVLTFGVTVRTEPRCCPAASGFSKTRAVGGVGLSTHARDRRCLAFELVRVIRSLFWKERKAVSLGKTAIASVATARVLIVRVSIAFLAHFLLI